MAQERTRLALYVPSLAVTVGLYGPCRASPVATVPLMRPLVASRDKPEGKFVPAQVRLRLPASVPASASDTLSPSRLFCPATLARLTNGLTVHRKAPPPTWEPSVSTI